MKIKSKLIGAFSIIVGVTIILGIIVFVSSTQIDDQFKFLVEHDLNVLQNAQKLQRLVVDAETGQRGFVITGQEDFLEPYYNGINGFDELIQVEKELVSDNPTQVEKLEMIEELFEEWKTKAAVPEIELARLVHETDVSAHDLEVLLAEGTGKRILDEIRENLDTLELRLEDIENFEAVAGAIQIGKDVVDRETGQRGFLVTGKEEFLEPYYAGDKRLGDDIEKLHTLLEGDAEDTQTLDRITVLIIFFS